MRVAFLIAGNNVHIIKSHFDLEFSTKVHRKLSGLDKNVDRKSKQIIHKTSKAKY